MPLPDAPGSVQEAAVGTSARSAVALAIIESIIRLLNIPKENMSTANSA